MNMVDVISEANHLFWINNKMHNCYLLFQLYARNSNTKELQAIVAVASILAGYFENILVTYALNWVKLNVVFMYFDVVIVCY